MNTRELELTKGYVAIVDAHRYNELASFSWRTLECADGRRYAMRSTTIGHDGYRGGCVYLHQEVMREFKGRPIDHRDGDGLHDWEENLRYASALQNNWNMRKHRDGSSRFKGVSWNKLRSKWTVRIKIASGRNAYLGLFEDEVEAALAYDAESRRQRGEFACVNFPVGRERPAMIA